MQTEMQSRLKDSFGISVTADWIQGCITRIPQQHQQQPVDHCLHQLLHSDLRDVVERPAPQATLITLHRIMNTNENENLIDLSTSVQKQETPPNFCLLVQLEEVLDISLNQEHRFNPQLQGSNNKRCLKLCISSGYENPRNALIAQEISSIANLAAASLAGLKLLLKGKILIRNGILQLHSGNTTVLGGSVKDLVKYQEQAIEKAKKQAGVGMDPTLRALIDPEDLPQDEDQPQDEAHEESRDTPIQPTATPAPTAVTIPQPRREIPPPAQQQQQQQQRTQTIAQHQVPTATARQRPPPNPAQHQVPTVAARQQPLPNLADRSNNHRNPYTKSNGSSTNNSGSQSPPRPSGARATTKNPYQQPISATDSAPPSASNSNPYATGAATNSNTTIRTTITGRPSTNSARGNPYSNHNSSSNNNNNIPSRTPLAEQPIDAVIPPPAIRPSFPVTSISIPTGNTETTFGSLYGLLEEALKDRQRYERDSAMTFKVAMKQIGAHNHFNIEKNPRFKKNKGLEKYTFVNNALFASGVGVESDRTIACKLPHEVTRGCFEKTATELRALAKTSRTECDQIVDRGGAIVKRKYYSKPLFFKVKFHPTADQVFASDSFAIDDVKNPILVIQPDENAE